jgi:hypothetical protein
VGSFTQEIWSGGHFVFLGYNVFFQPQHSSIILLKSSWLSHYTILTVLILLIWP